MAAKKRKSSGQKQSALKFLASALPKWLLVCVISVGICFGVLVETGVVKLSRVQELLDFTVFDEPVNVLTDNGENTQLTDELKRFGVYVLDVGQGDSIFINAGGTSILIDAGEEEYGDRVCSFLRSRDVETLDYIVATHPHSDHIGGMDDVIREFGAVKMIVPKIDKNNVPTSVCYENMLKAVKEKDMKLTAAKAGKTYTLGEIDGVQAAMTILSPAEGAVYDDLNDYSVAVRLDFGNTSFLFTGDMSEKAEKDLAESGYDIDVTALKVGHHGSGSSSSDRFLGKVTPKLCMISCGAGNSYGHPAESCLKRLSGYTDSIYRTDIDGTVAVYSDGSRLFVSCSRR